MCVYIYIYIYLYTSIHPLNSSQYSDQARIFSLDAQSVLGPCIDSSTPSAGSKGFIV